ncbi:CaiB/BaiF CoA transferase family protein [Chloroflexota bacterium]
MVRPLDGIRVLEWTVFQQGPVAGMMLADMGAEVIKIEDRVTGDPGRGMMSILGATTDIAGRNTYFEINNRGKRSVTLDLRKPQGREILYDLIKVSDVFLHNHRRNYASKLSLDYDTLSKINPMLIYATASSWGPKGPEALEPAMDYSGQAKAGLFYLIEEGLPPSYLYGCAPADQMGGIITAYGILGALLAKERLGVGQQLDASMLSGLVWLQSLAIAFTLLNGKEPRHTPRSEAGNPLWNHYRCGDDRWIALANSQADKAWPGLCKALGLEYLQNDPRFVDIAARGKNARELVQLLDGVFLTKTCDEWINILRQEAVIIARVNTLADLVSDEQVLANKFIEEFEHPVWGPIKVPANPVIYERTPLAITREAPEFGQHTEEVLIEILGMDWNQICQLKDGEII